jgi:hypothetical protein
MVPKTKLSIDVADLRDLIVPGLGNRRIFRILLTDACRHACDFCPMRAERDLPPHALEPARLARLFMTAFRRGWCDGLFITSGIPKDAVWAMDRMLEVVELLRVSHGYRGYLHVKAVAGAQPGQIEKLVRLVDRVSYNLEVPCRRAEEQDAQGPDFEKQAEVPVFELAAAAAVREARRDSARKAPPGLPPVPADRGNRAAMFAALRGRVVRPRPAQATLFPAANGVLSRPWGFAPGTFR